MAELPLCTEGTQPGLSQVWGPGRHLLVPPHQGSGSRSGGLSWDRLPPPPPMSITWEGFGPAGTSYWEIGVPEPGEAGGDVQSRVGHPSPRAAPQPLPRCRARGSSTLCPPTPAHPLIALAGG